MKTKIFCNGSFQKFPLALVGGLAFGFSVTPAPASQVVAYGYNMGVAPVLTNAVAVGVRSYSLIALRADATIAQWGNSASDPGISNVAAIASGGWPHALGLRTDGSIVGWGDDYGGGISSLPADLTNAVAVTVGFDTSLAIRPDGTVRAWGNAYANITNVPAGLSNVTTIAAGNDGSSALALRADGTVVEWGSGGTNTHPEISNAVAVATANVYFNAVLLSDGSVTVWPNGAPFYTAPDGLTNIVAISGAGSHMLALRNNGKVIAWGCDCRSDFVSTSNLTSVAAIAAGGGDGYDYSIFLINYTNPSPVLAAEMGNNLPRLRITGERFRHYVLEESPDPSLPANWTFKQNIVLPASAEFAIDLSAAAVGNARFYRARVTP